jgi:hypothetical protein
VARADQAAMPRRPGSAQGILDMACPPLPTRPGLVAVQLLARRGSGIVPELGKAYVFLRQGLGTHLHLQEKQGVFPRAGS